MSPPNQARRGLLFRRVILKHLRPYFAASEWVYSLRTKDRDEGKERAHTESVGTDGLITVANASLGYSGQGCFTPFGAGPPYGVNTTPLLSELPPRMRI